MHLFSPKVVYGAFLLEPLHHFVMTPLLILSLWHRNCLSVPYRVMYERGPRKEFKGYCFCPPKIAAFNQLPVSGEPPYTSIFSRQGI